MNNNHNPIFEPKLNTTYKCLLVGDSGTGKSTFLRRYATGIFDSHHRSTIGVSVSTMMVETNYKRIAFEVWDTAGDVRRGGLRNGYYLNGKCAIIMCDLSAVSSCVNVIRWLHEIQRMCTKQIPVVVCGNKADLDLSPELQLRYRQQTNFDYCEISTRGAWNLDAPFELLATRLLGYSDLRVIAQPVMSMQLSPTRRRQMREHLEAMHKNALPPPLTAALDSQMEEELHQGYILLN